MGHMGCFKYVTKFLRFQYDKMIIRVLLLWVEISPRIRTSLIWLATLGIAGGTIYHLHQNAGIPLDPGKVLESFGFIPAFTKEEAAESYLKSVCPTNSAQEKLLMRMALSNPNAVPDLEAYSLAEKYNQANSAAVSELNANNKKFIYLLYIPNLYLLVLRFIWF